MGFAAGLTPYRSRGAFLCAVGEGMSEWSPITESDLQGLLDEQLAACSQQERDLYSRIKTHLRRVPLQRFAEIEAVYLVGEYNGYLLVFDDVEGGFEWCRPDSDGIILDTRAIRPGFNRHFPISCQIDLPTRPRP